MTAHRYKLIALLLVLAVVLVFWETGYLDFVNWDDNHNVYENPYLEPVSVSNVVRFWRQPYFRMYVPMSYTVWAGIALVARTTGGDEGRRALSPHPFHIANAALHGVNVLLVFAILRLLVREDWPAAGGALFFGLHPLQVEPVAWVTGMKDVLYGLLGLVALWQYLMYAMATRNEPGAACARLHYVVATVSFLLALLAKPMAVVVPAIAWVLDRWVVGRSLRRCTLGMIPWVLVALPFVAITKFTQSSHVDPRIITPMWARPVVVGDALAFLLYKLTWPIQLGADYGRTPQLVLRHGWSYLTALLPAGLAVAAWLSRRRWPCLTAAVGVFLVGVLPPSGIVPFDFHQYSTVADRYVYVAMLGPALALAWLLSRCQGRLLGAVCVLLLSLLGFRSAHQTLYWHNTLTLFQHALEVNPNSWLAHNAVGRVLEETGDIDTAARHYRQALDIAPDSWEAHTNLGTILYRQGKTEQAAAHWRQAARFNPDLAGAHVNLGVALEDLGKTEEAMAHWREALRLDPQLPHVHDYMALALDMAGKTAQAHAHWEEALNIDPQYVPAHHNLAVSLHQRGRTDEATAHWREAVRIAPDFVAAQEALASALRTQRGGR